MSGESVTYFVRRDPDVSHLVRVREVADVGLWGEFFRDGQWHESAAVMDYLLDPLLGDRISEQKRRPSPPISAGERPGREI